MTESFTSGSLHVAGDGLAPGDTGELEAGWQSASEPIGRGVLDESWVSSLYLLTPSSP
jgi:hypothetical protein